MIEQDQSEPHGWLEKTVGPRWREVESYSARRGITLGEAVVELVNKGLSHDG